jgi:hypothetical protein
VYQNRRVKVTAQPADSVIRLTHKNASAKVTCATSTGGCTSADVAGEDVVCGRGQTWRLPYLHNVFLSKTPRAHDRPPDLRVFYVAAVKIARGHHHRLSTIKSRSVPFARIKYYSGTEIFTIWCAINKKKKPNSLSKAPSVLFILIFDLLDGNVEVSAATRWIPRGTFEIDELHVTLVVAFLLPRSSKTGDSEGVSERFCAGKVAVTGNIFELIDFPIFREIWGNERNRESERC